MTVSDSFSSATDRTRDDRLTVDLEAAGLLPPLPAAFVRGEALELLAPLGFGGASLPAQPTVDRTDLAAALAVANTAYGHPAAEQLAAKLADPATRVVVTGQQPGLFGGPLYTLSKAVAAALWADHLEKQGMPAVPVFWVATEDHDFREVARAAFPSREGVLSLDLGEDRAPLLPVGMRTLGSGVTAALERLSEIQGGERYSDWLAQVASWYRPETRFGEAFSRLLAGLLGERCPLLLDAMLPAVKTAQGEYLERFVTERRGIAAAFERQDRAIEGRGFALQVKPQPTASPLFMLHGQERRRVEWRAGDCFSLRGSEPFEESVDWLLDLIRENPAAVSAGVMGRPVLQDAILGTSLFLLGPGEMSYMPQVAPLYELLGVTPPAVALRPQMMALGRHQAERFETLGLTLRELLARDFERDAFLGATQVGDVVEPIRGEILERLETLKTEALAIDRDLERPWEKTRQQVEKALTAFAGRLTATVARQDEVSRSRLDDLVETCRPAGALQERVVSTAHYPGKFGAGLVDAMFEQMGLEPDRLHIIIPGGES